jgi:hypothetical protein
VKPVRVGLAVYVVGPLACPRCGRADRTHLSSIGILRLACDGTHCRAGWEAVRLPPGATGQQLIDAYGLDVARAVILALRPHDDAMSDDALALAPVPLADPLVPQYLHRMPDTPEPPMGWRRAAGILHSIMGRE